MINCDKFTGRLLMWLDTNGIQLHGYFIVILFQTLCLFCKGGSFVTAVREQFKYVLQVLRI